jgi:hypothetical protein
LRRRLEARVRQVGAPPVPAGALRRIQRRGRRASVRGGGIARRNSSGYGVTARSKEFGDGSPLAVAQLRALLPHHARHERIDNRLRRPLTQRRHRRHARISAGMTRGAVIVENGGAVGGLRESYGEKDCQHRNDVYGTCV